MFLHFLLSPLINFVVVLLALLSKSLLVYLRLHGKKILVQVAELSQHLCHVDPHDQFGPPLVVNRLEQFCLELDRAKKVAEPFLLSLSLFLIGELSLPFLEL